MAVRGTIRCGIVEWMSKPTVETRAEKLGMKLENESRVKKQPRTVENSREVSTLRMKVESKS